MRHWRQPKHGELVIGLLGDAIALFQIPDDCPCGGAWEERDLGSLCFRRVVIQGVQVSQVPHLPEGGVDVILRRYLPNCSCRR